MLLQGAIMLTNWWFGIEGVVICTDCKTPCDKFVFVILNYINKIDLTCYETFMPAKLIIHFYPQEGIISQCISCFRELAQYILYFFFSHVANSVSTSSKLRQPDSHISACSLCDPLCLWWLTLLSRVGINSLRKAYPILKPGIHRDHIGLVWLKATYWWELGG